MYALNPSFVSSGYTYENNYGMAIDSRIDQMIGLFCRIMSLLQGSFTKETYIFIDPTNQSHPIWHTSYNFKDPAHI